MNGCEGSNVAEATTTITGPEASGAEASSPAVEQEKSVQSSQANADIPAASSTTETCKEQNVPVALAASDSTAAQSSSEVCKDELQDSVKAVPTSSETPEPVAASAPTVCGPQSTVNAVTPAKSDTPVASAPEAQSPVQNMGSPPPSQSIASPPEQQKSERKRSGERKRFWAEREREREREREG